MVAYTGKPRQHGINNWEVFKAHIGGKRAVQNSLERISEVAQERRVAMEKPDWKEAGRPMREEWSFRKRNLPTISTKTIDRVIENARRNGALAGKVCGAGGGGCVVLLIEPDARDRMENTIREAGAEVLPMTIHRHAGPGLSSRRSGPKPRNGRALRSRRHRRRGRAPRSGNLGSFPSPARFPVILRNRSSRSLRARKDSSATWASHWRPRCSIAPGLRTARP